LLYNGFQKLFDIKFFRKKQNVDNYNNPVNVIGKIQPTIIEQILNQALSTGTWGSANRKGVAQVLQRLTFLQTISYLRRIMIPSVDASNSKVINMRHVDSHLYGYIDSIETPEGHKVNFGSNMEDFTKHNDEQRRQNYLKRSAGIRGNWKENKYSPNNLSRSLLW
jgi:DNA-directed RNA polymerase beta subunit